MLYSKLCVRIRPNPGSPLIDVHKCFHKLPCNQKWVEPRLELNYVEPGLVCAM